MKTFPIPRSKWARGGINGQSALLNYDGNMCCLGWFAKANGATDEQMEGVSSPCYFPMSKSVDKKLQQALAPLVRGISDSRLCVQMINSNDNEDHSESFREAELTKLFAEIGWEPKFEE